MCWWAVLSTAGRWGNDENYERNEPNFGSRSVWRGEELGKVHAYEERQTDPRSSLIDGYVNQLIARYDILDVLLIYLFSSAS